MSDKLQKKSKGTLSVFQLAMMTTISVASLRGLPAMAIEGYASILMYLIPALLFLVPTALVSAELGTTYSGGIFEWITKAFGKRLGFLAIWLQWIQNVVWFPIQLAFIASACAFVIGDPGGLSNSGIYTGIMIIVVYWIATFLALKGGNLFAKLSTIGGVIGILIPAGLLVVLAGIWLTTQKVSPDLANSSFLPKISGLSSLVLIISNILSYAGMEMNAVHVAQMKNPKKDFTKAIILAFGMILGIFIIPTLAIAVAVPASKIGMADGILVAFSTFFDYFGLPFMSNILALMIVLGALASVITWVAGPSRGLLAAAHQGLLPRKLQSTNQHGVQSSILVFQGVIVSLLALIYVIVPNVSDVFMALIGMASALYLIMYLFMFAASIILRKKDPDTPRGYKVPALLGVSTLGFIACALAFIVSFVPSSNEATIAPQLYPLVVLAVVVVLGVPPLIFYALRRPSWKAKD
ncbi:MAG: APC family permease [Streptococcaceae bacterium]|jgi:putative glutamate/gamma-aminobutyrate antiporter|nr:APC family permease [Streptococcaceae bacterium]